VFSPPDIDECALAANLVCGGFLASNVFVEVTEKYYVCASVLLLGDEFGEVVFEVVPGIWVFPFFCWNAVACWW
jgi:hypothetical protein